MVKMLKLNMGNLLLLRTLSLRIWRHQSYHNSNEELINGIPKNKNIAEECVYSLIKFCIKLFISSLGHWQVETTKLLEPVLKKQEEHAKAWVTSAGTCSQWFGLMTERL